MAKGDNVATGANHWNNKLTEDQVRKIKLELAKGANQSELARRFGVKPSTINHIASGYRWKSVF